MSKSGKKKRGHHYPKMPLFCKNFSVWLQNVYSFVTVPQKYNEFLEKKWFYQKMA